KGNITSLADEAFYANYKITSVNIPDTVTSIGKYAFQATRNLQTISLGNNITSIGSQAFLESGLSSITIPDSVTTIGTSVFRSMENLESVILGDKVNSIGSASFVGIPATAKIYCQDNDSRGKTCEELIRQNNQSALNQLQLFTRDNSGNMVLYDKNTDDTITSNGQTYADVSALKAALATSGNGNTGDSGTQTAPKRIYTVEEARQAVEAAGTETVNFRIRYK
ncbi:MAG: leucine-rich repeat domain-containing protein, partial [Alphaproteobacteria bacterium]|nr:leucine-rich repeat domain-containing protein [Alphaproteobacteria bacterium]